VYCTGTAGATSLQFSMFAENIYLQCEWERGQALTKNLDFYFRLQLSWSWDISAYRCGRYLQDQITTVCINLFTGFTVVVSHIQIVTS